MNPTRNALPGSAVLAALTLAGVVCLAVPAGAADLYRWVDDNGVVNYSNTPPKTRSGKQATLVEDRLSVYTPERTVTEAIERNRERRAQPAPAASFTRPPEPDRRASAPPPPPIPYDPCLVPGDPNCPAYLYDSSPVFHGRRRPVPLVQPQLPPGTIAGQAVGPGAYIAGQSASAPGAVAPPSRSSGGGFTVREKEHERDFRRR